MWQVGRIVNRGGNSEKRRIIKVRKNDNMRKKRHNRQDSLAV